MHHDVVELPSSVAEAVAHLWTVTDLVRPWNDPVGDFRRAVHGPTSAVLGILEASERFRVLGTVMVGVDGHRGWVYYLAVDPDRQGTGLGRQLMAAAEEWLRGAGAPKVQLMVRGTNRVVLGFYERLGYSDQSTVTLGKFLDPELEELRRHPN